MNQYAYAVRFIQRCNNSKSQIVGVLVTDLAGLLLFCVYIIHVNSLFKKSKLQNQARSTSFPESLENSKD